MKPKTKCFPSIIILLIILTLNANAKRSKQDDTFLENAELTMFYSEKLLGQGSEQVEGTAGTKLPSSRTEGKQYFLWQEDFPLVGAPLLAGGA